MTIRVVMPWNLGRTLSIGLALRYTACGNKLLCRKYSEFQFRSKAHARVSRNDIHR